MLTGRKTKSAHAQPGRKSIIESHNLTNRVIAMRRDKQLSHSEIRTAIEKALGRKISTSVVPYFFNKHGDPLDGVDTTFQAAHQEILTSRQITTDQAFHNRCMKRLEDTVDRLDRIEEEATAEYVRVKAMEAKAELLLEMMDLHQEEVVNRVVLDQVRAATIATQS